MKLIANIPRELNDLTVLDNKNLLLASDDSVYEVKILEESGNRLKLREIFRWTGTNMLSVDSYRNIVVAGTNRGVIIYDNNKANPVWVGYPCNVFAGKFSDKVDIVCLAKPSHKMSRILDVFVFSSKEVISGQIKSLRGIEEEIIYFSTSIGPIQEFAFNMMKNLTVKADIDNDGYLELVLITPEREPKLCIVDIMDESIYLKEYDLPVFVGNPILLDIRDLNEDGENELYVVSMLSDFEAVISVLRLQEERVTASVITKIDVREFFGDNISDDGLLYVFIGQFDKDGLPEIVGLWEEPSEEDGYISRLMLFKINILGSAKVERNKIIEEIAIKRILPVDIDSDGLLELVIFNESGASIYKIKESRKGLSLDKIKEFRLPILIKLVSKMKENLLIGGQITTRTNSYWSLLRIDLESKIIESIDIVPSLLNIWQFNDYCIALTENRELLIIGKRCTKRIRNVLDAMLLGSRVLTIIQKKGLQELKIGKNKCRLRVKKIMDIDKMSYNCFMIMSKANIDNIYILNNNQIIEVNAKEIQAKIINIPLEALKNKELLNGYHYIERRKDYFLIISRESFTLLDKRGNIILKQEVDFDDRRILKFVHKKDAVLLYTRNGELYKWDLSKKFEERLNLDNVTALNFFDHSERLLIAFSNNWIAEYTLDEVISPEYSSPNT